MRKIYTLLIAVMTTLGVAFGGVALADGPSGSTEDDNALECGTSEAPPESPIAVYAAENGVEACNDGGDLPIQGRVIVSAEDEFVAADGTDFNEEPLNGYVRLDAEGVHCGSDSNQDSTADDQSGNTIDDCFSDVEPPAPPA